MLIAEVGCDERDRLLEADTGDHPFAQQRVGGTEARARDSWKWLGWHTGPQKAEVRNTRSESRQGVAKPGGDELHPLDAGDDQRVRPDVPGVRQQIAGDPVDASAVGVLRGLRPG